jgi:hypothetical protein
VGSKAHAYITVFHIFQTLPATISLCYASIKETYCRLAFYSQVLNSYSKFVVIPRKLMIGKRLSQCIHPALPSGVHLKALETYNLIFERIGKKRLSQDLFIYSVGLFPLMSHSAMSVKPALMKLYEEHFLPLGMALVPSLPGLLLGLLPGIEEGSDYTERY